jgi:hypothetical protein
LVSNLIFIRNLTVDLVFFLIGLIDNVLFSFLYSIPFCSEGNIVDHISAKHKLAWCCLHRCMICASNIMLTMQLIEGSNQMDYLLMFLHFHDYFPSQIIWAYHWHTTTLYTCLMIAFACRLMVLTCSWFGFNDIIVLHTHLFEPTFEVAHFHIVKDNKLRSRVTCQPGTMKQILNGCCWLICGFNNFKLTCGCIAGSIIVSANRECVLAGVIIVHGTTRCTQTMTQGYNVRFCYLGWYQPIFLALMILLCHLT